MVGAPSLWARRTVNTCCGARQRLWRLDAAGARPRARCRGRRSARRAAFPAVRGRRPAARAGISCAMRPLTITPMRSATSMRHAQVLLDQQHGDLALGRQVAQRLCHLFDDHRRQAFGGLVHDQQLRLQQQRAADGQHLLFAARELRAAVALAFGQAREHRIDALESRRLGATRRRVSSTVSEGQTRRPCGT